MVDIMGTVVVLYISYNPASCHRVTLNMPMTSTWVLFNPIFHFLFKTHSAKTNLLFISVPGRVAQSVTCLATDACLTADPGVASSIPARYHTFVEIDHETISTVILLPSADLFKKGCCQLQAKVCA